MGNEINTLQTQTGQTPEAQPLHATPPRVTNAIVATVAGAGAAAVVGALLVGGMNLTGLGDHLAGSMDYSAFDSSDLTNIGKGALAMTPAELANHGVFLNEKTPTMLDKIAMFLAPADDALKALPPLEAKEAIDNMYAFLKPDGSVIKFVNAEQLDKFVATVSKDNPAIAEWARAAGHSGKFADVILQYDNAASVAEEESANAAKTVVKKAATTLAEGDIKAISSYVSDNAKTGVSLVSKDQLDAMSHIVSKHVVIGEKAYDMMINTKTYDPTKFVSALGKIEGFDVKGAMSMIDGAKWGALIGGAKVGMESLGEHRALEQQFAQAQQNSWQARLGVQQQAATALLNARAAKEAQGWVARTSAENSATTCQTL